MRNVFLSVVIIAALVTAGLGGTFAHFSDTEESLENFIQTGSLDLKVSDVNGVLYDDAPYGEGVPQLIFALDLEPKQSKDYKWDLQNAGQPEGDPAWVYMHIKKIKCEDIVPHKGGVLAPNGKIKPEPEVVAEFGGRVGQTDVPGVGPDFGCTGDLEKHIHMRIWYDENGNGTLDTGEVKHDGKMDEIICKNLMLGRLDKCWTRDVHADVRLQDIDEDDLIAAGILPDPWAGNPPAGHDGGWFDGNDPDIQRKCWDKWPTNALMKDKITFSILFSLVDGDEPPGPP